MLRVGKQSQFLKCRVYLYQTYVRQWDSALGYGLDVPGFGPDRGKNFHFSKASSPALGPTQPHIQWVPEFFPDAEGPERDIDQSPPSSAEVKNDWNYTSAPPYVFTAWTGTTLLYLRL
jgi:hypothetical protein